MAGEDPIIAGMAGRYALALFELALEAKKLKAVEADLTSFAGLLEGSPDLNRLVRSPVFSAEEQARAVAAIAKSAKLSPLTTNFLQLIANNRRLFAISDMIRAFNALVARHRGEVTAEVTSANKLSAEQTKTLKAALKSAVGQDVQITSHVDPAVLGGLVVKVGSRMIDTSLKTKLNNLQYAMKEVG
ncbi:MAG: F0F1 ATP synthase subunit delta [Hyphomicrobiaceae bacterium]|nr:F0F1 ATP synthase subunit delta [Hyphomicrobiaceae bacterium]